MRDTPWPTWLYPVNALLLGGYALTALLDEWRLVVWLAIAAVTLAVNVTVGMRMGTPWILPTSRGFLVCIILAAACLVAAVTIGPGHTVAVAALAASASMLYLVGALVHHRSTHR